MEKELCFKFLEHLYKYASGVLKKERIEAVDITYINNEVGNFLGRVKPELTAGYDKAGALAKIEKIPEETGKDKALNVSKFLIKARIPLLRLFMGDEDDAHAQRAAKVDAFRERVKKVITVMELAQ